MPRVPGEGLPEHPWGRRFAGLDTQSASPQAGDEDGAAKTCYQSIARDIQWWRTMRATATKHRTWALYWYVKRCVILPPQPQKIVLGGSIQLARLDHHPGLSQLASPFQSYFDGLSLGEVSADNLTQLDSPWLRENERLAAQTLPAATSCTRCH